MIEKLADNLSRREVMAYLVIVALFLAVNLLTADRSPPVWVDEIYMLEPAANVAAGKPFAGSLELLESDTPPMWVGYAPLYSWLLSGWIRVFGVGATEVRSLNISLVVIVAGMFVFSGKRAGLFTIPWLRVCLFGLWLCAYGVTFCYRCGRVDVVNMLVIGLQALLWTAAAGPRTTVLIGLVAAASPWASPQVCVLSGLLTTIALVLSRGAMWRQWIATASGGIVGCVIFWVIYETLGVWERYWGLISSFVNSYFVGSSGFHDLSLGVLAGIAVVSMGAARVRRCRAAVWAAGLGLALSLIVALGMMVIGHFPTYYSWMAFLPLWMGWGTAIDRLCRETDWRPVGWFALAGMCIVGGVGLPARVAVILKQWDARDYAHVERLVDAHIRPGDIVVVDFPAYYAVRPLAAGMMVGGEAKRGSEATWDRVDAIVGNEQYFEALSAQRGPGWREVGRADPSAVRQYQLRVYRRDGDRGESR